MYGILEDNKRNSNSHEEKDKDNHKDAEEENDTQDTENNMVPLHHQTKLTISGFTPRSSPATAKGGIEDTPFENCAKKRRIGTTSANIYASFCTVVTSATVPPAIGGITYKYGEQKPAPVPVKIDRSEREKEEGTAPAANTTALAQLACQVGST